MQHRNDNTESDIVRGLELYGDGGISDDIWMIR